MAKRNYISDDFAAKLDRARRLVQRIPQRHQARPRMPSAPIVSSLFRVYNNSGETIPEYAVMQVEELTNRTGFTGTAEDAYGVVKPGSGGDNQDELGTTFLINAGDEIEAGKFGAGIFLSEPGIALVDPAAASPEFGDAFGPVADEWHMSAEGSGYAWIGLPDTDKGTAVFREKFAASTHAGGLDYGGASFSGTPTKIPFNSLTEATVGTYIEPNTTDSNITVRKDGLYFVTFSTAASSITGDGFITFLLYKNNSVSIYDNSFAEASGGVGVTPAVAFSGPISLLTDDVLDVRGNTAGATITLRKSIFTLTWLGS